MRLEAAAGRPCRLEQCGLTFPSSLQLEAHQVHHREEMRRRLVCCQEGCGRQLDSPQDWRSHTEEHRERLRQKVVNGVRSVLLYNKHGLLLEALAREYREAVGEFLPLKALGFDRLIDFMVSLEGVVEVRMVDRQILLLGLPDPSTLHMARMVANQREGREGYNYRTTQLLKGLDMEDVEELATPTSRQVPAHLISQLRELVEVEGHLLLATLPDRFHGEFGYPLEWRHLGFTCLEDLLTSTTLATVFTITMEDAGWMVGLVQEVEEQLEDFSTFQGQVKVPGEVEERLVTILGQHTSGLALSRLPLVYSEWGRLEAGAWGCKDLLELCLALPHLCQVVAEEGGGVRSWVSGWEDREYLLCPPHLLHHLPEGGPGKAGHIPLAKAEARETRRARGLQSCRKCGLLGHPARWLPVLHSPPGSASPPLAARCSWGTCPPPPRRTGSGTWWGTWGRSSLSRCSPPIPPCRWAPAGGRVGGGRWWGWRPGRAARR